MPALTPRRTQNPKPPKSPIWRETVWHAVRSGVVRSWWARLAGWTLTVEQLGPGKGFGASLHRFRDGGADMPQLGAFPAPRAAREACEAYARERGRA
jgi:hypothetical protein